MSGAVLTMVETAAAVGLSYERFRKVWPDLDGFPRPFWGRKWDAQAVADWKAARSVRPVVTALPAPGPGAARLRREREQLRALRAGR